MQEQRERAAPPPADTPFQRGMALHEAGKLDEAITAFSEALERDLADVDSAVALGHCLLDKGGPAEAAGFLDAALQLFPEDVRVLILKGRALLALGQTKSAIRTLSLALAVEPGNAAAHTGLAQALAADGEVDRGLLHSITAFRLVSDHAHASNCSGMLNMKGNYQDALTMAEYALSRQQNHLGALLNWAAALDGLGRLEDAVFAGQQALIAAPGHQQGRLMLAGLYLRLGLLTAEAWDLYECRHDLVDSKPAWLQAPLWSGEDLAGRTILLHAEQGLGDTLHFVRYAPLVAARAGRVILAVQPPLLRLLHAVPGADQVVATGGALPPADVVCPLLSLPRLFGTTLASIPPALPYAGQFPPWQDIGEGVRVGLAWAGNPAFAHDRQRSLPPAALAPLAGAPGVTFFSLQLQQANGAPAPPELGAIDLMAGVQDFADTAALVAGMDLVIAADSAVAHLAATMGKPVWLLSRFRGCWRWLHDRADSPWYPSMTIYRQTRLNDWAEIIEQVRRDLLAFASRHQA